jgi:DNA polymerase-1
MNVTKLKYVQDDETKKVWHNYSFDKHVLENHGIKPRGFGGDTMQMARLWDSSRTRGVSNFTY